MTLHLDLSPGLTARLEEAARASGAELEECARKLLDEHLPELNAGESEDPTVALLRAWREEDETEDPAEVDQAEAQLHELQLAIDSNRSAAGARRLFP